MCATARGCRRLRVRVSVLIGTRLTILAAIVAIVVGHARPAWAHQSSIKYVELVVDPAHTAIAVKVLVAPSDVTEPLGLAADARPTVAAASTPAVARYVRGWLAITGCTPAGERATPDLDGTFVAVRWDVQCAAPPSALALDFSGLFSLDPLHEAVLTVVEGEADREPLVVRATRPRPVIELAPIGGSGRGGLALLGSVGLAVLAGGALVLVVRYLRRRRAM